jgi:hypothetical protein
MAVELARINAELGAMGTFFVLLRGHAYNPASQASQERLAELLSLGQRLAFLRNGIVAVGAAYEHVYMVRRTRRVPCGVFR